MLINLAEKQTIPEPFPNRIMRPEGIMRPGTVKTVGADNRFRVVVQKQGEQQETWAIAALADTGKPSVGDKVLLAGENLDECYIIALLESEKTQRKSKLTGRQGGSAEIVRQNGQDCIRVRDKNDRILFEYNADTGKGMLAMPLGDLVLHAPNGNIDLISGKALRCLAHDTISVGSARQVQLSVSADPDKQPSHLILEQDQTSLSGHSLKIAGEQGSFCIQEAKYEGQKLSATVAQAKLIFDRLETMAVRCIERVRDVFRYVEKLSHLKTGRMRTLVDEDYNLQSGRATITTKEDVKIRGKRIHLG